MLLAMQLAKHKPWACRSTNLIPIHCECVDLLEQLTAAGVSWDIRHVYREYNQVADALANQAVDEKNVYVQSAEW